MASYQEAQGMHACGGAQEAQAQAMREFTAHCHQRSECVGCLNQGCTVRVTVRPRGRDGSTIDYTGSCARGNGVLPTNSR